jgi:hypothetical protein
MTAFLDRRNQISTIFCPNNKLSVWVDFLSVSLPAAFAGLSSWFNKPHLIQHKWLKLCQIKIRPPADSLTHTLLACTHTHSHITLFFHHCTQCRCKVGLYCRDKGDLESGMNWAVMHLTQIQHTGKTSLSETQKVVLHLPLGQSPCQNSAMKIARSRSFSQASTQSGSAAAATAAEDWPRSFLVLSNWQRPNRTRPGCPACHLPLTWWDTLSKRELSGTDISRASQHKLTCPVRTSEGPLLWQRAAQCTELLACYYTIEADGEWLNNSTSCSAGTTTDKLSS